MQLPTLKLFEGRKSTMEKNLFCSRKMTITYIKIFIMTTKYDRNDESDIRQTAGIHVYIDNKVITAMPTTDRRMNRRIIL